MHYKQYVIQDNAKDLEFTSLPIFIHNCSSIFLLLVKHHYILMHSPFHKYVLIHSMILHFLLDL